MILGLLHASVPADFRRTEISSIGYERLIETRLADPSCSRGDLRPRWDIEGSPR